MRVGNEVMIRQAGTWQAHWFAYGRHVLISRTINLMGRHPTRRLCWWGGRDTKSFNSKPLAPLSLSSCGNSDALIWNYDALPVSMSRQLWPVGSRCSSEAEVHSLRTTVGRRCPLASCISFIPGYHYSHSSFCARHLPALFRFCPHLPPLGPFLNSACSPDFCVAMPKLRHHMRCHKGGSRRSHSPSPSSHSSPSRSLCDNAPHHLRGSGQARCLPPSPRNDTFASHHYFEPRPAFITSPPSSKPPISSQTSPSGPPVSLPIDKGSSHSAGDSSFGPLQATGTLAGEREVADATPQRVPDLDPEEKEGWGCRIEEESPSSDYGL